uniref:Uncharacterized protein n=1 Tax=viral metagenome TaxID=1070528 RepID=A0A6C0D2S3_9ZZZZ
MKREIRYPIFLDCTRFCGKDVFWKFVFEDMAYGKFPPGIYIQKDYLCCSSKGKEFVYKMMDNGEMMKSEQEVYEEIRNLLQTRACLLSDKEALFQRRNILHSRQIQFERERYNEESWNVIRKKIIKENLMEEYVLESRNKYELDSQQIKRLFSLIILGFIFKSIHSKDVSYSNGYIQAIEGFEFSPRTVQCTKNIYNTELAPITYSIHSSPTLSSPLTPLKNTNPLTTTTTTLSSHWVKYIAGLTMNKKQSS